MSTSAQAVTGSVLVTGADGFIGSHLVEALLAAGKSVRAFCLYNSFGSAGWLDRSKIFTEALADGRAELMLGDIRDPERVSSAVSGMRAVLHLAALIAIPYSYEAPRSYLDTNVMGTLNVLEAVRRHGTPRMVHTSTSEVYGTPASVPITESHPLQGQSPYSASKIAADKMCEAFARSFDTPVAILRPFNTYGPRQSSRAVIPTVLGQLLAGRPEVRIGALSPQRDFTFVTDTCDAFLQALDAFLEPGEVVQLGTGSAVSIADLVDHCMRVTGHRVEIRTDEARMRPPSSEVDRLLSDPTRARERLGWRAVVSLEDGLRETTEWMMTGSDLSNVGRYQR